MRVRVVSASELETDPVRELGWGDHWLRVDLEEALRRLGHDPVSSVETADVILYMFGFPPARLGYMTLPDRAYKVVWLHSHPDLASLDVLSAFDSVHSQSSVFAEHLRQQGLEVATTDGATSKSPVYWDKLYDVVFVGNARPDKPYGRPIIRDLGDQPWNVRVWGRMWEGKMPPRYFAGEYFPNRELDRLYSSSRIVLNDHHPDMAKEGFPNFRIFDALAAGSLVISDANQGVTRVFGDTVPQYETPEELQTLVAHFLEHDEERERLAAEGQRIALRYTYDSVAVALLRGAREFLKNGKF